MTDLPDPTHDALLAARFAAARRTARPADSLDAPVLADARRVLGRYRWLAGARGWTMAAAAGIAVGVSAWAVIVPMGRSPDMVDVLRAARAGRPANEVAGLAAAAVRVDRKSAGRTGS